MAEEEIPKEIAVMSQWCLGEALKVAARVEKRYEVKLSNNEVAELANSMFVQIGSAMRRLGSSH